MSASRSTTDRIVRAIVLWGLIGVGGIGFADESEAPELDFLEYLGSWEESDEDWVVLAPDAAVNEESDEEKEEVDTAPNGEKLAELDDE